MKMSRFLWLLIGLLCSVVAKADRKGFHYENFHVEAVVHQDNVWEITETIDVFFDEPRHGIYRYVPLRFSLEHDVSQDEGMHQQVIQGQVVQDWRTFKYKSEVDDVEVEGGEFTTEDSDDDTFVVRIGDADSEVLGKHRYVIKYKYVYREDRRSNYDYLFHTILGTDFNEDIDQFSFRIEFEKSLPSDIQKRLEVYSGGYGKKSTNVKDLVIKANQHVIAGKAKNILPHHGITLYAKLPEGYYEGVKSVNYLWHYMALFITLMLILAIGFYLLKTKRKKPVKVIEFYPPEGISSAEVGTIIDGSVDTIDIASLIPWLAGKGYLTIEEKDEGGLFKMPEAILTKVKDLPQSAPTYQKKMMSLLFGSKGTTTNLKDLGEKPSQVETLKKSLKDSFKGEKKLSYFHKMGIGLYVLLICFSTVVFGTNSVDETFNINEWIVAVFVWSVPFFIGAYGRLYDSSKDLFGSVWKRILVFGIKMAVMALLCYFYCDQIMEYGAPMPTWLVISLFAICFLLGELIGRFNIDTDYRVEMIGRLLGFKEFIKTAEKNRLESLQQEDPTYFYKVLPYAMVFGLSKKWGKLFKDIKVEQPDWYITASPILAHNLTTHMASSLYSSTNHAISIVSHDSSSSGGGGGHSGGGFSGGGGGGGGGGSW